MGSKLHHADADVRTWYLIGFAGGTFNSLEAVVVASLNETSQWWWWHAAGVDMNVGAGHCAVSMNAATGNQP